MIAFEMLLQQTQAATHAVTTTYTREILHEIGGKNKGKRQIKAADNAFLVLDNLEVGFDQKIPLWLFGFLY